MILTTEHITNTVSRFFSNKAVKKAWLFGISYKVIWDTANVYKNIEM
jgi:hypothetical protein